MLKVETFYSCNDHTGASCQQCTRVGAKLLHDRHHKVSSSIKVHHNTRLLRLLRLLRNKSVKYEVFVKKYLHAILDISDKIRRWTILSCVVKK